MQNNEFLAREEHCGGDFVSWGWEVKQPVVIIPTCLFRIPDLIYFLSKWRDEITPGIGHSFAKAATSSHCRAEHHHLELEHNNDTVLNIHSHRAHAS